MKKNRANSIPELLVTKQVPRYLQIYEAFRVAVGKGQLVAGQRVPSSRELAARYGVARITVGQAYEQLVAEGYLETRQGAGTFVALDLPEEFLRSQTVGTQLETVLEVAGKGGGDGSSDFARQRPFVSGCPDLESFPRELWGKLYLRHLRRSEDVLALRVSAGGSRKLREAIAGHLNTHRGLRCEAEQILILNGSQPGIDLVGRMLLEKGDRVAVENPCYRGIATSLRLNGGELLPCAVDENGMSLERLRKGRRKVRMAVVTPCRQFPLGTAMPLARRLELMEWAERNGSWILEDDYDSEFRFRGRPLPAMQGMGVSDRILYLGTFSRSMFPDLRIGYLVVPFALLADFRSAWATMGMSPSAALQDTLADFIQEGHYLRHLRRMRLLYAKRSRWLVERIRCELGEWLELQGTDGGLHFVGYLPKGIDGEWLWRQGRELGVELIPLSRYALEPLEREGLLLGFARYGEAEMERGVQLLKQLLRMGA